MATGEQAPLHILVEEPPDPSLGHWMREIPGNGKRRIERPEGDEITTDDPEEE